MEGRSDGDLMEAYAGGCGDSFDELFRRYEGRAYAFFRRRLASAEQAGDLYQELFLRLHRFRHTYDPRQAFAPWFFQIARNVLADERRRAFRRRALALDAIREPAGEGDPERRAAAREQVARLLSHLPLDQARLLLEAKGLGRGYGELAADRGKSVAALKQAASRSLRRLRVALVALER